MRKELLMAFAFALPAGILLTGCTDDNYDLSDIDTTSRIKVDNLTIPVNIDPIKLGDVIKLESESKFQSVEINGQEFYALVHDGSFKSEDISIAGVKATPTPISETRDPLYRIIGEASSKRRAAENVYKFGIKEIGNQFSYNAFNIDDAIVSLDAVTTEPFTFGISLEIIDEASTISSLSFEDLVISVPKGLEATPSIGTYEPSAGLWKIPRADVIGNKISESLKVTGIDMITAGVKILEDRSLDFHSQFIIQSGFVDVVPNTPDFRDEVILAVNYGLSEFEITSFTGQIHYELEGLNIDPVSLGSIPTFLQGDKTNLEIANPQIYLEVNNPVAQVPLECSTGMTITALRTDSPSIPFSLPSPIILAEGVSPVAMQKFVLSPSDKDLVKHGYSWQSYPSLGSILTTPDSQEFNGVKGLPGSLSITFDNPSVPTQRVENFKLPQEFSRVTGNYEIIAPLALKDGSYIYYTEVRDGWYDDDLKDLTISALTITAHAVNNVPANIELTVYPLDINGNTINGAEIKSNIVKSESEGDLTIQLTGEIKDLDGIRIEAKIESTGNEEPLSSSQTLDLTDIRAKVSGYYDRKF